MIEAALHVQCLVQVPEDSGFSIYNLPYGVFKAKHKRPTVGVAIGTIVIDLAAAFEKGLFQHHLAENVFLCDSLNDFMSMDKSVHLAVRKVLQSWLTGKLSGWKQTQAGVDWWPMQEVNMLLPFKVAGYTDFYSGMEHAKNVGKMFRPAAEPLLPNWKHMPVAYHGRSSSVVVSGTAIHRPQGQYIDEKGAVVFGPTKKLDYEMELGFVIGKSSTLGYPVSTGSAMEHVFGCVLLNDLSARDLQRWEYQPLGPFLGKNFGTTISPWVVPIIALEPFLINGHMQDVEVLTYLKDIKLSAYDIDLKMELITNHGSAHTVGVVNARHVYWSIAQQIAHHTINGCNLQTGDILATGTISSISPESWGSLLERTFDGTAPLDLGNEKRTYLEDGDTLIYSGWTQKGAVKIGFGEAVTPILPAITNS